MVTREEVKDSVEYEWRGLQWRYGIGILVFVMVLGYVLMALVSRTFRIDLASYGFIVAAFAVFLVPFILHAVYQQRMLLRGIQQYQRYQVRLCNAVTCAYNSRIYAYHVGFQTEEGELAVLKTKPIFSNHLHLPFSFHDFHDKKVEIFYDPEKERIIVSRKV